MATKTLTVCDGFSHEQDEDVIAPHQRTFHAGRLDLCDICVTSFDALMHNVAEWASRAQPLQAPAPARAPRRTSSDSRPSRPDNREENAAIREWAKTQPDVDLGDRGRIPDAVRERYREVQRAKRERQFEEEIQSRPVPAPPPVRSAPRPLPGYSGPYTPPTYGHNGQTDGGFDPTAVHSS